MSEWNQVSEVLPKEGELVDTTSEGVGRVQPLRYRDERWWLPDYSADLMYTPTHWKAKW